MAASIRVHKRTTPDRVRSAHLTAMIIDLPNTQTKEIEHRIRALREERGDVTSGRVLTLIVVASEDDDLDRIVSSTHDASREHPARVIVLVMHRSEEALLDAQLRIGGCLLYTSPSPRD